MDPIEIKYSFRHTSSKKVTLSSDHRIPQETDSPTSHHKESLAFSQLCARAGIESRRSPSHPVMKRSRSLRKLDGSGEWLRDTTQRTSQEHKARLSIPLKSELSRMSPGPNKRF